MVYNMYNTTNVLRNYAYKCNNIIKCTADSTQINTVNTPHSA